MTNLKSMIVGVLVLGTVATCAYAANWDIVENFNDNNRNNALWKRFQDRIKISERNKRLNSKNSASQGGTDVSGYRSKFKIDFTEAYRVQFDYKMAAPADEISGNEWAAVGLRAFPPGDIEEVYIAVVKDTSGLTLVWESWSEFGLEESEEVALPSSLKEGKLEIQYNPNTDRFTVRIDSAVIMNFANFLDGVATGNGRTKLEFAVGRKGRIEWGWNKVFIDNVRVIADIS